VRNPNAEANVVPEFTPLLDQLSPSHCLPRGSGQGIVAAKTSTLLRGRLMSALGQKRTFALQ
jgi:hypothetical protein